MTRSLVVSAVVLAMLRTLSLGYAQPSGSTGFYPKNFVDGETPPPEAVQGSTRPSPREGEASKPQKSTVPDASANNSDASQATRQRATLSGVVYATSIDENHFSQVCNKVLGLQRQGKIRISLILHYGDFTHVSRQQETMLLRHGISILELRELPGDLPVSQSPAWLIYNQHASSDSDSNTPLAYLVEGYFNIEQFFDQYGVFSPPAGMLDDRSVGQVSGQLAGF